jgi:hypothetical protein
MGIISDLEVAESETSSTSSFKLQAQALGPGRALRKSVAVKVVISFLGMSNLIIVFKIVS